MVYKILYGSPLSLSWCLTLKEAKEEAYSNIAGGGIQSVGIKAYYYKDSKITSEIKKDLYDISELVGELKYTLILKNIKGKTWIKTLAKCNAQRFIEDIK